MTPTISIFIPVYNMAGFLPDAVESALGRRYADLELVIVDNASTDGSYEIAADYARRDARVRAVRNDTNIGPLANFNRDSSFARGAWLRVPLRRRLAGRRLARAAHGGVAAGSARHELRRAARVSSDGA